MTFRMRRSKNATNTLVASVLAAAALEVGCEKEEAPPPPPQANVTPQVSRPPPPPAWTLEDISMHENVEFPAHNSPRSEDVARAIASFASALAAGDNVTLQSMLGERDRLVLEAMVRSGHWDRETSAIEGVRVAVVEDQGGGSFRVGLAIQNPSSAYLTGWQANGGGDAWSFSGLNVGVVEAEQAPMLDGSALQPPSGG